ncbi:OsmC family protein [Lipingzhangella sp. LS1_29]|uniref:OsmC family protein n=1 Tax=Lipingzhangella rawalii TaxID=2055835 RepID=A0ABU2HDA2_9ACTN|nr:OsmC family protein [Lipingzhangella rawalii]MDS1272539.1 OsmC family protein [Lipingzhangella rawalii]
MTTGLRDHHYEVEVRWTGNTGTGTTSYRDFSRAYEMRAEGKPVVAGSADPAFRGDAAQWNPEELLISALSACHMLWFLHRAAAAGVVVTEYRDAATGTMSLQRSGAGQMTEVVLRPAVTVREPAMVGRLAGLHEEANERCFVARSVSFPVRHEGTATVAS